MNVRLFLAGDVMTGRGIDQVLASPCDPRLEEPFVHNALDYVRLAESVHGPIPRPVPHEYIWGDILAELERAAPTVRIVNLETTVTSSNERADKGINYRMSPANAACLAAARIDCCVLANNHVLDWGRPGLVETIDTLKREGIRTAGAGRTRQEAEAPAELSLPSGSRLLVFSVAEPSSGVPRSWTARTDRPGIALLRNLSDVEVELIANRILRARRAGDLVVLSVHWGANWGYEVSAEERRFAHATVQRAGVDIFHGHSSHHPKAIEVVDGKLILYGCGDLVNDYEGISGHEAFRSDLGVLYFADIDAGSGRLAALEMSVTQMRRFSANRAADADVRWLSERLSMESKRFGTTLELISGQRLRLRSRG